MKICSLCKSKYDDRVDFCFRDGTPLVPMEDEAPAADAPADDLYSSATRPFIVQPEGGAKPVDLLDVPEAPDRFASGDGLDVPEPRFGFDPAAADVPEPSLAIDAPEASLDAPEPASSAAFDAPDVPAASFLDAPEPPMQLDAPEPASLSAAEQLEPPRPVQLDAAHDRGLSHSETMVPDEPVAPSESEDPELPGPDVSDSFGMAEEFDDSFAPLGDDADADQDDHGDLEEEEDDDDLAAAAVFGSDSAYVPPPDVQPGSSNRNLFIVFGVVGAIAVLVILWILFGMDRGSGEIETPPRPNPVTQAAPPPAPRPVPPAQPLPPPVEQPEDQPEGDQAVADILEMPTDLPEDAPPAQPEPPAQTPPAQTPPRTSPPAQTPPAQTPPRTSPPAQTPPAQGGGDQASPWGSADGGSSTTTATDGGGRDIWGSGGQAPVAATKGSLTIRSNPMGAMVYVGNEMVGRTPMVGKEFAEGSHMVRVELDGYSSVSKVANIKAGAASDLGTVQLESQAPVSGYVTLWADDLIGAKVYIDNQYVGELPVKVELNEGKHAFFVQPAEGEAFTINRDVKFDVQGIGISIDLGRN